MKSVWITKRKGKKGTRYIVRWINPITGKNRGKTFRRLEDARDYQADLRRGTQANESPPPATIGYSDWVERHLHDLKNSPEIDLAPKTIAGHKEALMLLGWTCKPMSPLDITPKMMRNFRHILEENLYAPRTINKHIAAIRSALSYAVRAEYIPVNKLIGQHRLTLPEEQPEIHILEVREVAALLNCAKDLRHKAAISLAYYHGLRRREISNLRWKDISFEQQKIDVMHRPYARTKTKRSRTVALRRETTDLLQQLCVQGTNEYVFEKPTAFYFSVDKWFKKLIKSTGISYCTLHDLRKTCNTMMKNAGVSAEAAMQILGHSTFKVNQKYYTGVLTEQQKLAINSIPSAG